MQASHYHHNCRWLAPAKQLARQAASCNKGTIRDAHAKVVEESVATAAVPAGAAAAAAGCRCLAIAAGGGRGGDL